MKLTYFIHLAVLILLAVVSVQAATSTEVMEPTTITTEAPTTEGNGAASTMISLLLVGVCTAVAKILY